MRPNDACRLELASSKPAPASPDFFSWLVVSVADRDLLWPKTHRSCRAGAPAARPA